MAETLTYTSICRDLRAGRPAPVYLLHGEEGYYIDALVDWFVKLVPESDRDFDLTVLYAPELSSPLEVVNAARRVPMFSQRQVVVVKEVQNGGATFLNALASYVASPNPASVLCLCFRQHIGGFVERTALGRQAVVAEEIIGIDHQRVDYLNLLNAPEHVLRTVDAVLKIAGIVGVHSLAATFERCAVLLEQTARIIHFVAQVGQFGQREDGLAVPLGTGSLKRIGSLGIASGGHIKPSKFHADVGILRLAFGNFIEHVDCGRCLAVLGKLQGIGYCLRSHHRPTSQRCK